MFRAPLRRLRPASLPAARAVVPRRAASTASGAKKGTWKGTAARWGVAGAAVYWYCTSPIFADDPAPQVKVPVAEDEELTVEKVIEQKRKEIEARAREREAKEAQQAEAQKQLQEQEQKKPKAEQGEGEAVAVPAEAGSPQALEEEAGQQGAFNPETGEINWDCPCLGGMAHGPCGEEFRAAFSCFVYSEEEPKGMDCIDKFQGMQDCFRRHPDVYGAELAEEEEAEAEARAAAAAEQEGKPAEEPAAPKEAAPAAEKQAAPAQEKEVAPAAPAPEKDALAANEGKAAPAEETAAKEEKKTDA